MEENCGKVCGEITGGFIMSTVRSQLATDLNCSSEDFDGSGFVFCMAKENMGRRPFPRAKQHFEMLTMGGAVVVSATPDILTYLRGQLEGKSRDDAFSLPFVYGHGLYYLPDNLCPLPLPGDYSFEILNRGKIPYYGTSASNIASQRVAHRAGFKPAWICAWRGVFDGIATEPTG